VTTGGYFVKMPDKNVVREAQTPFKHLDAAPVAAAKTGVREVPVKEAKAKLTELLRAAEAGERIVLTRHGKPVADLVPHGAGQAEEKPMSLLDRVEAWHKANPSPDIGWISDDFDDPLPEDFLLQPLPDDFDENLAAHNRRVEQAWAKMEAENRRAGKGK
jgi:prevent-host-death family protein